MEFTQKIIAYIDILGWKQLVKSAEGGTGPALADLLSWLECLGTGKERASLAQTGPKCCPAAPFRDRHLDFQVTQVSDCVIVSAEISPCGVINLLWHCWRAVFQLLEHGILCRGYVRLGQIYHTERHLVGSGYQDAFEAERGVNAFRGEADERGTPFVQVDQAVTDFIDRSADACVKAMYSRMTKRQGETVALFPFQRLARSFIVTGVGQVFDADRERKSNANLRKHIERYKRAVESHIDHSRPDVERKGAHYLAALDAQLSVCDETDRVIDRLDPAPARRRPP
jgi:hypothetical protein